MNDQSNVRWFATLLLLMASIAVLGLNQGERAAHATPTGAPSMNPVPALGCRVAKHASQALANNALTALAFDFQINDATPNDDCWIPAEPTRLYARAGGYYLAGGAITLNGFASSASGKIEVIIRKGGTTWLQAQTEHLQVLDDATYSVATGMIHMNNGEYIEIVAYHTLGANISTYKSGTCEHCLNGWLVKVGD